MRPVNNLRKKIIENIEQNERKTMLRLNKKVAINYQNNKILNDVFTSFNNLLNSSS